MTALRLGLSSPVSAVLSPQYYHHIIFATTAVSTKKGPVSEDDEGIGGEEATARSLPPYKATMASFLPQPSQGPPYTSPLPPP